MIVAGLVDVLERHVTEPLRIPAQITVVTGVVSGKCIEVEQDPDDGGDQQGPPPLVEQGQGNVLDGAGLLQVAQVLEMVAELLEEHGDQGLGLHIVTGNRNLEKNALLNSKSSIYSMDIHISEWSQSTNKHFAQIDCHPACNYLPIMDFLQQIKYSGDLFYNSHKVYKF